MLRNFNNATGAFVNAGNVDGAHKIECDAHNCYYNKGQNCIAPHIKVGPQNAVTSGETICATFRPR